MRRKRLLVLATYPASAAATRFRACGYFEALAERGIDAELRPFLDEAFLQHFYEPGQRTRKALGLARFMAQRALLAAQARRYDGIMVQREAALIGPAWIETTLARGLRLPMVFDFDDAIWVEHTASSRHPLAARLLKAPGKTAQLLRMSCEVVAGSRYLAAYASSVAPASRVTVLPTVVSRDAFQPLAGRLDGALASLDGIPTIGWIGTHTSAAHLPVALPAMQALAREGVPFRVRLVGAGRTLPIDGVEVESVPWTQATEIAEYQRVDVGIAPLVDDEWARGKCAFKQIQYMAVGAPMVSSAVGGAAEILEHGETAMIARTTSEWTAHLRALLGDPALRARLARAGRRLVEERLSTEAQAPIFAALVERALSSAPRG